MLFSPSRFSSKWKEKWLKPTFEENLTKWVQKLPYFIFLNVCLLTRFRGSTLNTQVLVYPKFWQKGSKLAQK